MPRIQTLYCTDETSFGERPLFVRAHMDPTPRLLSCFSVHSVLQCVPSFGLLVAASCRRRLKKIVKCPWKETRKLQARSDTSKRCGWYFGSVVSNVLFKCSRQFSLPRALECETRINSSGSTFLQSMAQLLPSEGSLHANELSSPLHMTSCRSHVHLN